jgi:amino acid transporter
MLVHVDTWYRYCLAHDKYLFSLARVFCSHESLWQLARDGLLPSFFSDIHRSTQIPLKSTIVTGLFAAVLAFFMDVSQLAGMVSLVVQ